MGHAIYCVHYLIELFVKIRHVLLDTIETGADRHWTHVANPINAGQIASRFPESLVQSALKLLKQITHLFGLFIAFCFTYLYPDHHVQVTLRVLFDDVANVVRFSSLLEFSTSYEVFDFSDCPDGVSMCIGKSENSMNFKTILKYWLYILSRKCNLTM